jgi:hypothetical protein
VLAGAWVAVAAGAQAESTMVAIKKILIKPNTFLNIFILLFYFEKNYRAFLVFIGVIY